MSGLITGWLASLAAILTIGHLLDGWMPSKERERLGQRLLLLMKQRRSEWMRQTSELFLSVFDQLYGWRPGLIREILWFAILFSYAILLLTRLTLDLFDLGVSTTEEFLLISLGVTVGAVLVINAFLEGSSIYRFFREANSFKEKLYCLWQYRWRLSAAMAGISVYTLLAMHSDDAVGGGTKAVIAIVFASVFIFPLALLVELVPAKTLRVDPVRSLISSVFFIGLISVIHRDAALSFVQALMAGEYLVITYIAFNIFADTVSMAETRWVLKRSQDRGIYSLPLLLVLDVLLSAGLYLILPALAKQDLYTLGSALMFDGPEPWLGIFFWTTFSTSALLYAFFVVLFLASLLHPLVARIAYLDHIFEFGQHPLRALSIVTSLAFTVVYVSALTLST